MHKYQQKYIFANENFSLKKSESVRYLNERNIACFPQLKSDRLTSSFDSLLLITRVSKQAHNRSLNSAIKLQIYAIWKRENKGRRTEVLQTL